MSNTPPGLIQDLQSVGVPVRDIWELVNSRDQYPAAIPVLMDWLRDLDARAQGPGQAKLREGIIRALTVPAARPVAARLLIDEFRRVDDPTGVGLRWAVGNALSVVADDSVFDDIESLVRDGAYGRSREMVVRGLGRSKDRRAVPLLIDLLSEGTLTISALSALRRLKAREARPRIEMLLHHPEPDIRKEAKKVLAALR